MLTINIKRSVGALAVTAGLLAAGAPASHAYDLETVMISGYSSSATHPGSSANVLENSMISSVNAKTTKGAKGKRGKGKPAHTYDIQSSNHV